MKLEKKFNDFIIQENLFAAGDKLLLAVSGGLDSRVLLHLCHIAGYDIEVMHVNFRLRGDESDRDENFVRSLAGHYQIPLHITSFDTRAFSQSKKLSIQAAARELRYQWFGEIRARFKDRSAWIVTAHHLDDNIETSLMNWVKGTGIRGLRGMMPKQNGLARPLLFASRAELETYATEQKLQWVEDSSNRDDHYTRNFMRHRVLPLLEQAHPQATQNLADNLQRFREAEELYEQAMAVHRKALLFAKENEWHIPVEKLKLSKPLRTISFELLRPFGFLSSQLPDILRLLEGESGKYISSSTHRIIRHRRWLIVAPVAVENNTVIAVDGPGIVAGTGLEITVLKRAPEVIDVSNNICFIPKRLVQFPLVLRRWKTGDYFYPLGMHKKKKLARFFNDQRLSKTQREQQWVLEMNGKIIWLPGLRLDDRFKLTGREEEVVRVTYKL